MQFKLNLFCIPKIILLNDYFSRRLSKMRYVFATVNSLYVPYRIHTYVSNIVRYINKCKDKFENILLINMEYNIECVLHILNKNFNDIKFCYFYTRDVLVRNNINITSRIMQEYLPLDEPNRRISIVSYICIL